jgi:hypothetical protein
MLAPSHFRLSRVISLMFLALRGLSGRPAGRQSTVAAVAGAVGVAIAGAVVWGLVERLFNIQFSLISVAIGAGVGYMVARYRTGHMPTIIAGVVIAVLGCALGSFLALVFAVMSEGYTLGYIFSNLAAVIRLYPHTLGGLTLLFWLVAAYAAFRVPWQGHRIAARRAAAAGAGYGSAAAGAGPAGYGTPGGAYGSPAQPGQAPDLGLPPFTDPGIPPGSGQAGPA